MSDHPAALQRLERDLSAIAGVDLRLERPAKAEHGDYATNVALRIAPSRGRAPRELADELAAAALELPAVDRAEVAGPGFLNLWLTPEWFGDALAELLAAGVTYGGGSGKGRIQVEMVSATPTGPVTVASARN